MVISLDQSAGQNCNIRIDNNSFEVVEQFEYSETTQMNQNSIHYENKIRLKSGNTCCHLVQNLLSSSVLSKNIEVKIQRTVILPVVFYGYEKWSVTLRKEHRLRMLQS